MSLERFGWSPYFAGEWDKQFGDTDLWPGRVASSQRGFYTVWTEDGEVEAPARAKLVRNPQTKPVTGDWVALTRHTPTVQGVLPRRTRLARKAPGSETIEQVLGANLDTLFIVSGLDRDFNPRRLERFLTIGWESGATPVVVLNKADLCGNPEVALEQVRAIAHGAAVVLTSAAAGQGIEELRSFLRPRETAVFTGSSGVGKSHLTNCLFGADIRKVGEVRPADGRGRHTTVGRDIVIHPEGWLLMDLPGVREVQAWTDEGVEQAFADIEAIAEQCRFRDCGHQEEPGCAIREALECGALERQRCENYRKLQAELSELGRRQEARAGIDEKRGVKTIQKAFRKSPKRR